MMLDSLGERYGVLPSEVLERASTFDLWVYDIAISYRNYRTEKEMKDKTESKPQQFDPDMLQKGLEKFRERQNR